MDLNVEVKENMNQIIEDFIHHSEEFGLQSFGDGKTLKKLHLHFRMIPTRGENELGRSRIEGSVTSLKA